MKRTFTPTQSKIERNWHVIDASGKILGKLAVEAAKVLVGKNKATYTPNINVGDKVIVVNASKVDVTGRKFTDKKYFRYTGFPGGIKEMTMQQMYEKNPARIIKTAVNGMLPKNKLRKERIANLFIYNDATHPHQAQIKQVESK